MEYAVTDAEGLHMRKKTGAHAAIDAIISTPTLGGVVDETMQRWEKVFSLAETLMLHETNDKLVNLTKSCKDLLGAPMQSLDANLPAIVREVSAALPPSAA